MSQIIREADVLKGWGSVLEMVQLSKLSLDPRTLHESVRKEVIGYLQNQDLIKRDSSGEL